MWKGIKFTVCTFLRVLQNRRYRHISNEPGINHMFATSSCVMNCFCTLKLIFEALHVYAKKMFVAGCIGGWKQTGRPLIFLSLGVISDRMLWVCMRTHAHTSRALLINMARVGRNRYRLTFSAQLPTLPQSALLITTGTFHTVLDLINDFSSPPPSLHIPRSCSPCSLSHLLTFLLLSR